MTEQRTVCLVGMMGAGKSTVGPALARRLHLGFVDTDPEIAREAGGSIAEIFAQDGEPAFRERERSAVKPTSPRASRWTPTTSPPATSWSAWCVPWKARGPA